jgi:hypothetical protein
MTNTADFLALKARAKEIFCATYSYPAVPFRSIGRRCFKSAMVAARREADQLARLKAIPPRSGPPVWRPLRRLSAMPGWSKTTGRLRPTFPGWPQSWPPSGPWREGATMNMLQRAPVVRIATLPPRSS